MHIRAAVISDDRTIADANVALAHESEGLALDPARALEGVRAVLGDPSRGRYFVAEVDGAVVGQLLVTPEWSDWRATWFWWIQSVWVSPAHRDRGVYRALHQRVLTEAARDGVSCLKLYVDRDNRRAQAVYEALGMERSHYELFEAEVGSSKGSSLSAGSKVQRPKSKVGD